MFRKVKKKKAAATSRRSAHPSDEEDDDGEVGVLLKQSFAAASSALPLSSTQQQQNNNNDSKEQDTNDDDEETGLTLKLQQQRKNRKKNQRTRLADTSSSSSSLRTTITSAQGSSRKRRRRHQHRIGYGGGSGGDKSGGGDDDDDDDAGEGCLYDREALAQLRAEQEQWNKETRQQQQQTRDENVMVSEKNVVMEMNKDNDEEPATNKKKEEDFIALDGGDQTSSAENRNSPTILAGDEAMEAALGDARAVDHGGDNEDDDKSEKRQKLDSVLAADATVEDDEATTGLWQDQIAKRAGVAPSAATKKRDFARPGKTQTLLSVDELRQTFVDAQTSLQLQIEDTQTALDRRQVDIQHTQQEELQQQTSTVKSCGTALEFYQRWRAQAVPHVAALRELAGKCNKVQRAVIHLLSENHQLVRTRQLSRVDDVLASLPLENVLGRPPDPNSRVVIEEEATRQVDEFGRHVPSRQALEREKRERELAKLEQERLERKANNKNNEDDTVLGKEASQWMLDAEIQETRHQQSSFSEALQFAVQQVSLEFRSLGQLSNLFTEWYQRYPQEYKDCFVGLSFADLAGVLIQVDAYTQLLKNGSFTWKKGEAGELGDEMERNWLKIIHEAKSSNLFDKDALVRLVEKSFLPLISGVIRDGGYSASSCHQTNDLTRLAKLAFTVAGVEVKSTSAWKTLLGQPLLDCFKASLVDLSFPVSSHEHAHTESVLKLSMEQLLRVDLLLQNIFAWRDCIGLEQFDQAMAERILNFLQNTFLPFLSSLNSLKTRSIDSDDSNRDLADRVVSQGTKGFLTIWQLLQPTGWLQRSDLLVQATTLQAAAEVYANG